MHFLNWELSKFLSHPLKRTLKLKTNCTRYNTRRVCPTRLTRLIGKKGLEQICVKIRGKIKSYLYFKSGLGG